MRQVGYTKEFAAGVICNAGTLGILIPPSIVMVVYAAAVEVSVGRMFLAGVIPGLLAGFMLMVAIYIMAKVKNLPKGEWAGWGEIFASGREAGWGLFLIVIILGGIYGGIFTPTEAAAVAAVYAFFIASFVYRDMGPLATHGDEANVSLAKKPWALLTCLLPPRHSRDAVRGGQTDGDASLRYRQRAYPEARSDRRAGAAEDRRSHALGRVRSDRVPDRGQRDPADRRPVHGAIRPTGNRRTSGVSRSPSNWASTRSTSGSSWS